MSVRWTETALKEIEQLFAYISDRNPRAADLVIERTEQTVAGLADFPESASMTDKPGVRARQIGRYPFLILYSIEAGDIVILHVRHAARRRPWDDES